MNSKTKYKNVKPKENIFVFVRIEKEKLKQDGCLYESCPRQFQVFQAVRVVEIPLQAPSKNHSKMPGVTARSAAKNMSKTAKGKAAKNSRRVEAAINDELEFCTYGRVSRTLGNKMFRVIDTSRREHLGHIRGKMARIGVNDVVLLNIRDYESRAGSDDAVYDIVAVFDSKKDIHRLIKSKLIPAWLASTSATEEEGTSLHDLFDYEESESEDEEEDGHDKKTKKNHRKAGKNAIDEASDSDAEINIDDI